MKRLPETVWKAGVERQCCGRPVVKLGEGSLQAQNKCSPQLGDGKPASKLRLSSERIRARVVRPGLARTTPAKASALITTSAAVTRQLVLLCRKQVTLNEKESGFVEPWAA